MTPPTEELKVALPELPEPDGWIGANDLDPDAGVEGYTAKQMQDYALQAVKEEREWCARLCEQEFTDAGWNGHYIAAAQGCAAAIRRGK